MTEWGTVADWVVAVGTLIVAVVAVGQETIRGWFYRPRFQVSVKTEPPDCLGVPWSTPDGKLVANSIFLRLWVENVGNATAVNAEVYAKELRRKRMDGIWETVVAFPPMNLKWANGFGVYFPNIAPDMGKHCDLGHITDPACRHLVGEDSPALHLTAQQTSLAFDVFERPNHKGHIIPPGEYELAILVAAQNARPMRQTVLVSLRGQWDADETRMLRDGVGVRVAS